MRAIESIGLQRFGQFPYSYVIHPRDGEILEGCGLLRGAHTSQRNSTTFGVAWCGNYEERAAKVQQVESTRWLINHLVEEGWLVPGADILGHRDTGYATACPGRNLYALLDAIRVPWEGPMATDRPRVNAPVVGGMPSYDPATGDIKGYILIGADGGTFHFGQGVPMLGNVEYSPPAGRDWLPGA